MRTWEHLGYEGLLYNELVAIVGYTERCNQSELAAHIRNNAEQSQGFRDFVADVIAGKFVRPKSKRGTNEKRDYEIYLSVRDLMDVFITKENAFAQVAPKFNMSDDGVNSAYRRIKKKHFSGNKKKGKKMPISSP